LLSKVSSLVEGNPRVDTSVFKAHSVRGASSAAASEKRVLIEDILRTTDWSTDHIPEILLPFHSEECLCPGCAADKNNSTNLNVV